MPYYMFNVSELYSKGQTLFHCLVYLLELFSPFLFFGQMMMCLGPQDSNLLVLITVSNQGLIYTYRPR